MEKETMMGPIAIKKEDADKFIRELVAHRNKVFNQLKDALAEEYEYETIAGLETHVETLMMKMKGE